MDTLLNDLPRTKRALGVGTTKVYELTNLGEIERVYIGHKALWTTASLKAYVSRLQGERSEALEKRNANLKHVETAGA